MSISGQVPAPIIRRCSSCRRARRSAILGCLGDYTWCDVIFQGNRGWMRSIYLQGWYSGYYYSLRDYAPRLGYRVVSFDLGRLLGCQLSRPARSMPTATDGAAGSPYGEGATNRGAFYNRLAPYGNWIWLQGQYVWVPQNVGPVLAALYGRPLGVHRPLWLDVGLQRAVRLGDLSLRTLGILQSRRLVLGAGQSLGAGLGVVAHRRTTISPGRRCRRPMTKASASRSMRASVPDYYWQVVPNRDFLSDDLPRRIVRDKNRFNPILRETQPLGNVTITNNNVVVNKVVNVNYIEQKTNEKVVVHKVERTKDEKTAGKVQGDSIEIFQPAAETATEPVAPPKPKQIDEVAAESKTKEQGGGAPSTDQLLVPPDVKTPALPEAAETGPTPAKAQRTASGAGERRCRRRHHHRPRRRRNGAAPPAEAAAPPPPPPPADEAAPPPPPAEETRSAPASRSGGRGCSAAPSARPRRTRRRRLLHSREERRRHRDARRRRLRKSRRRLRRRPRKPRRHRRLLLPSRRRRRR